MDTPPMYEVRISSNREDLCEFQEHTIDVTRLHNWHKDIELMFVTAGSGYINYNADKLTMNKGDIVVINSNAMHRTYCENGNTVTYHYLIIYESFYNEIGIDISDCYFEKKIIDEEIWDIYKQLLNITNNKENMTHQIYILKLRKILLSLLIELLDKHLITNETENTPEKSSIECLKKAIKYVNKYYMNHITLDEIAKYSSTSKYYLVREFKKYAGQTLFAYINTVRCRNANIFILNGMSVSEAAYKCGFENMSYFSKVFQKHVGVLPSKITQSKKLNK